MAMLDTVGIKIEPGSGVGAAQSYWRAHDTIQKKKEVAPNVVCASRSTGST